MAEAHTPLEGVPAIFREILKAKEFREDKVSNCVELVYEISQDFIDQYGNIHGSLLALLSIIAAESIARMQIFSDEYLVVVSHTINFITQPDTLGDLEFKACIIGKGERVLHVQTAITCHGKEIANALTMFIVEQSA
jgi:predicted transcriptional regulator